MGTRSRETKTAEVRLEAPHTDFSEALAGSVTPRANRSSNSTRFSALNEGLPFDQAVERFTELVLADLRLPRAIPRAGSPSVAVRQLRSTLFDGELGMELRSDRTLAEFARNLCSVLVSSCAGDPWVHTKE
jgi:hypothetical protein